MDWDGIGTFALFLSSGAVGLAVIGLKAYKARLAAKLEWARLERSNETDDISSEQLQNMEEQIQRLSDRVDFTERLLEKGPDSPS